MDTVMLSSSERSKLFEKFKFQRRERQKNEAKGLQDENCRKTGSQLSTVHSISDSDDESTRSTTKTDEGRSSQTSQSDKSSPTTEKTLTNGTSHVISDSDSASTTTASSTPRKNSNAITKSSSSKASSVIKSRIKNRRALEDDSDTSDEDKKTESPKKYSRIKSLSDFKYKKRTKCNNSDDERSERRSYLSSKRKADSALGGKKGKRAKEEEEDSEGQWSENVVGDSEDDSDEEVVITDKMTSTKQKVFDFINSASLEELLLVQSCTEKKANIILSSRPYTGWKHLVLTFRDEKQLSTKLLNNTLDVLRTRDIVSRLMKKCLSLAISTEQAIKEGAGLKHQPTNLTRSLQLKSYQMVGLNWLAVMHKQDLNGILADEMGLGKTIQVIAFLAYLKGARHTRAPHLVVAPTSTIDNWAIEFTRWCPDLRVVIYHGSIDERRAQRVEWFKTKFSSMDIIITTYQMIGSNNEDKKMFRIMPLHYVVFDEAHMLKNMNTQRYANLFQVNAQRRILLTGTPLQNNLLELMSLLNFVMPNMFASKIQYIKSFFTKNVKMVNGTACSSFEQQQVELAKRIMKPFVLRRLKTEVLKDLPPKTNSVIKCKMNEVQKVKYADLVSELKEALDNNEPGLTYLSSFMQMRKLANHPLTFRYHYQDDVLQEMASRLSTDYVYKDNDEKHIFEDLIYLSDHEIHQLTQEYTCVKKFKLDDKLFLQSGKFEKFDEILPKLKEEGHRVCVFSQFVFMLDIIEDYMRIRDYTCVRLDGSTNIADRQELIDEFNDDSDIFAFLLSTKAGGMGINLTSADTVIIHDIDFNPYNDKQAEDRCHRLGQTRPVHIIRMISEDTVEERIHAQALSKLELEQELTGGDDESENTKNVELLLKEALGLRQ